MILGNPWKDVEKTLEGAVSEYGKLHLQEKK